MKKKNTVFDYLIQIFMIYGVTMVCICAFCMMFGENAREVSTLFALGSQGISVNTMLQFFVLSVIIATLRFVLFTDGLVKNIPMVVRTLLMFSVIIAVIVLFVVWFGWFPVNMWQPWVMFFVCFLVSAIVSAVLSYVKEQHENKKMEEALNELKKGI